MEEKERELMLKLKLYLLRKTLDKHGAADYEITPPDRSPGGKVYEF